MQPGNKRILTNLMEAKITANADFIFICWLVGWLVLRDINPSWIIQFRRSNNKTWAWLRKENFERETESLQIAAQNNAVRTNHIKARIEKTEQNSKCKLCGDWDETINHMISECAKLAQKEYKTRHDWVGKVIHWEMCKKLKFDQTNKWYMHNPAAVLENYTYKLLWNFDIQTDHQISARRPDLIIIKKKKKKKKKRREIEKL